MNHRAEILQWPDQLPETPPFSTLSVLDQLSSASILCRRWFLQTTGEFLGLVLTGSLVTNQPRLGLTSLSNRIYVVSHSVKPRAVFSTKKEPKWRDRTHDMDIKVRKSATWTWRQFSFLCMTATAGWQNDRSKEASSASNIVWKSMELVVR